jgi:hypothetical protein
MQNPFESGHIKNYVLLYASVVVIMILFFIASTLFHDVENLEKKEFKRDVDKNRSLHVESVEKAEEKAANKSRFKLLDKAY